MSQYGVQVSLNSEADFSVLNLVTYQSRLASRRIEYGRHRDFQEAGEVRHSGVVGAAEDGQFAEEHVQVPLVRGHGEQLAVLAPFHVL